MNYHESFDYNFFDENYEEFHVFHHPHRVWSINRELVKKNFPLFIESFISSQFHLCLEKKIIKKYV